MAVHSVSDLTRYIKRLFDRENVLRNLQVCGELSNFKKYASGHCYFTLKDAASCLKCVMFRSRAQGVRFVPENGMKVVLTGTVSVYERDGLYQLYVEQMIPEGTGELALAFEQLKKKLEAEGLFDISKKKVLPPFPKRIGIVTSQSGAVLRDIFHVSKRRWPSIQLVLYPVQVQGDDAATQIAKGITFFNCAFPVDVLIVGRGGGSMEDLWAFNEECVVRAIYESDIPVISAVGHETDVTLSDFASDVRAATPSQAAELAVPDRYELLRYVRVIKTRLREQARRCMDTKRLKLNACLGHTLFRTPEMLLAARRERLDRTMEQFDALLEKNMQAKRHRLELALKKLDMLSPAQVLMRGYAMVERDGTSVTSVHDVVCGSLLSLCMKDGRLAVRVDSIQPAERTM